MKTAKLLFTIALFVVLTLSAHADPSGSNVVISEVLFNPAGGGESGREWIELYNPTAFDINIGLWSIQKEGQITNLVSFPPGTTIKAHSYLLIGDDGILPADLPTPDFTGIVSSLVNGGDGINLKDSSLTIVDSVGWLITNTDYFEGTALTTSIDGSSIERKQGGSCGNAKDTDDNSVDFYYNPNPTPQNSFNSSVSPCAPDLTPPGTIENLTAYNITNQSFYLSWDNPSDLDFDYNILYIDGANVGNVSGSPVSISGSGINPGTDYNVTIHTVDTEGNVNDTDVTLIVTTASNPTPQVPTITITSPVNESVVITSDVLVSFNVSNWTASGKGSDHVHFHIDGHDVLSFSEHLMFYNGADQTVELNGAATEHASWINEHTIQFNNLSNGLYTVRAHLADSSHAIPTNNEADTFIELNVTVAECTLDSECDDGLFCNGAETCTNGVCNAGTPINTDDGVSCTIDSCDEVNDEIVHTADDSICDNGLFCDGAETCHLTLDCQAGTTVSCDNGQFCDGVEYCDEDADSCANGAAPDTNDNVSCTVDSCNETTDSIEHTPMDSLCDDGLYCNGVETCDLTLDCQAGTTVVCSGNDISEVATCTHSPDDNSLTYDSRSAFTSTCDEDADACTTGDDTVAHACSLTCGAGCGSDLDCGLNEVCDLNSCGCVPDTLPRISIDYPTNSDEINNSNVTVSFSTENFVPSGKGSDYVYFTFNGIEQLSDADELRFYAGADQIIELNDSNGGTQFASFLTNNSFSLYNMASGDHTLTAQLRYANGTDVSESGASDSVTFTVNRPADPVCGDNSKNTEHEVCDGTDLNGMTCTDFGYTNPGMVSCSLTCDSFDISLCASVCGNGDVEPTEQCDDGNTDNDDGCSSTCELEHYDDLMINYLTGSVSFDGGIVAGSSAYTVDILTGDNAGMSFNGNLGVEGDNYQLVKQGESFRAYYEENGEIKTLEFTYTSADKLDADNPVLKIYESNNGWNIERTLSLGSTITVDGNVVPEVAQLKVLTYTYNVYAIGDYLNDNFDIYVNTLDSGLSFNTLDQLSFSTGAEFNVTADNCNAFYSGTFNHGGNSGIMLDCTLDPVIESVYNMPSVPHDLENTIIYSNVTDENNNIDSVTLHYALNGTNATAQMTESSGMYVYNLGTLDLNTSISYSVWVNDTYGNMDMSSESSFVVITHDYDKDGSNSTLDCNDFDNSIYPGAAEQVDAIDQNCVNDAPVLVSDITNQTWNEDFDNNLAFDLDNFFSDVDDNGLVTYSVSGNSDILVTIDENNVVNFTQPENWNGEETVIFTANDSKTTTDSNPVVLTVNAVNDGPVFDFTLENITARETDLIDLNATGLVSATDVDSSNLTFTYTCGPAPCDINSSSQWQTDLGDKGTYYANVTVSDGSLSETQTVTITVTKRFEGDVNGDSIVNILDLILVRQAFGLTSADAGWDPELDVNSDGKIDILDLIFIRTKFT